MTKKVSFTRLKFRQEIEGDKNVQHCSRKESLEDSASQRKETQRGSQEGLEDS